MKKFIKRCRGGQFLCAIKNGVAVVLKTLKRKKPSYKTLMKCQYGREAKAYKRRKFTPLLTGDD